MGVQPLKARILRIAHLLAPFETAALVMAEVLAWWLPHSYSAAVKFCNQKLR
jgi:hypothetical protein